MELGFLWGPIAVFSDAHGNSWAMDAVLRDIEWRGVRELIDLGNAYCGPLDPLGTAETLERRAASRVRVKGLDERRLCDRTIASPTLARARAQLGDTRIAEIARLPTLRESRSIALFHGCPENDTEYLLEDITADATLGLASDETIRGRLQVLYETVQIVVCGRSHTQRTVQLTSGVLAISPGSVGLPAFKAKRPRPHSAENGTPHARYAIMRMCDAGIEIQHIAVPYDWKTAAKTAFENGRIEWADWLATGRAG